MNSLEIFIFLIKVDHQTSYLLEKLMNIILPIIYALGSFALIFSIVKYSLKIHFEPEKKGEYFKNMFWSVIASAAVLLSSSFANIIFNKFLGII